MFSCTKAQHIYCTNTVETVQSATEKIYSNYTEVADTCSTAQQHSTFTVQILDKLYSLKLKCSYRNYTDAVATCSVAQENNKFIVQVLYKVHN